MCILRSISRLKLPVTHGRYIGPYVFQIDAFWIHRVTMAAIVLYFTATMTARLYWSPNSTKGFRFSFSIIKQTIMTWMQTTGYRQASADLKADPVPKLQIDLF